MEPEDLLCLQMLLSSSRPFARCHYVNLAESLLPSCSARKYLLQRSRFGLEKPTTQKGDLAEAHHCFVNWSPDQLVSKWNNVLPEDRDIERQSGAEKGGGEQLGTKRPELPPRSCHSLAASWVKSTILRRGGLVSTPFPHPPPSQLWSQAMPSYLLSHRSSSLSLSAILLVQFSLHFVFSIFQVPHPLRPNSSAPCLVCAPPAHQGTQSSNCHSMLVEDRTDTMPISYLVCIGLVAFRKPEEAYCCWISGRVFVILCSLYAEGQAGLSKKGRQGSFWVACQWNIYISHCFSITQD